MATPIPVTVQEARPRVVAGVEAQSPFAQNALGSTHVLYSGGELHIELWNTSVRSHHLTLREPHVTLSFDAAQLAELHHALGEYLDLVAEEDAREAMLARELQEAQG